MKRLPFAALVAGLLLLPPALPAQQWDSAYVDAYMDAFQDAIDSEYTSDTCKIVLADARMGLDFARSSGLADSTLGVHWVTFPDPRKRGNARGTIRAMKIEVSRHIARAETITTTLIHESLHASLKDIWAFAFDREKNAGGAAEMCRGYVKHPAVVRPYLVRSPSAGRLRRPSSGYRFK